MSLVSSLMGQKGRSSEVVVGVWLTEISGSDAVDKIKMGAINLFIRINVNQKAKTKVAN